MEKKLYIMATVCTRQLVCFSAISVVPNDFKVIKKQKTFKSGND